MSHVDHIIASTPIRAGTENSSKPGSGHDFDKDARSNDMIDAEEIKKALYEAPGGLAEYDEKDEQEEQWEGIPTVAEECAAFSEIHSKLDAYNKRSSKVMDTDTIYEEARENVKLLHAMATGQWFEDNKDSRY